MNAFALLLAIVAQATQPVDPTMDWLLDQAGPASASTQPAATQPASPFGEKPVAGERTGTITLSDGKVVRGTIRTTPGKPIRMWNEERQAFVDLPMDSIQSMEAVILWERDEPEWRFKESGHDEKIYTGKTYPARETQYRVILSTGDTLTGGIVAPLYVTADGKSNQFVLYKRSKGDVGKTLAELVYVRHVALD